jgi:hypothetical protein
MIKAILIRSGISIGVFLDNGHCGVASRAGTATESLAKMEN